MTKGGDPMKKHNESRRAFLIGAACGSVHDSPVGAADALLALLYGRVLTPRRSENMRQKDWRQSSEI
jgi:hypothetical protein